MRSNSMINKAGQTEICRIIRLCFRGATTAMVLASDSGSTGPRSGTRRMDQGQAAGGIVVKWQILVDYNQVGSY